MLPTVLGKFVTHTHTMDMYYYVCTLHDYTPYAWCRVEPTSLLVKAASACKALDEPVRRQAPAYVRRLSPDVSALTHRGRLRWRGPRALVATMNILIVLGL